MSRLVLVEDDPRIRAALEQAMRDRDHDVRTCATGMSALHDILEDPPDVVILDLGLPDIDGYELLRMLRAVSEVPVIAATARDGDDDIVRTLDAGADDYIVKPFTADQLAARIRALLRRTAPETDGALVVGDLVVDVRARSASVDGQAVSLTRKEFDLLAYLAARPDQVVGKRELLAAIWHQPYGGADKTVDVHLSWLRRKLGETAAEPRFLRAVRGVGVKLVDPAR